jgi:hypothetical protein
MVLAALGWALIVSREVVRFGVYADETTRTGGFLMLSSIQLLSALTEFAVVAVLASVCAPVAHAESDPSASRSAHRGSSRYPSIMSAPNPDKSLISTTC